jgi:putative endopeptidase
VALAAAVGTGVLRGQSSAVPATPAARAGIDIAGMDKSIPPGDDFFRFANGGWLKATEMPPDRSRYGVFAVLSDDAAVDTRQLLEKAASGSAPSGSDERRIGDYYASYIDEAAIEAKGLEPARPFLQEIAGLADRRALAAWIGRNLRADVDPLNATNFQTHRLFGV